MSRLPLVETYHTAIPTATTNQRSLIESHNNHANRVTDYIFMYVFSTLLQWNKNALSWNVCRFPNEYLKPKNCFKIDL